ncbi:MAG: hypothetical protein AMXMBFR53_28270 [Gemmatimonadota bacterium]
MADLKPWGGGGLRRPRRALTALVLGLAAAGCYRYTPVEPAAAPAGSSVRIRVAPGVPLAVGAVPLPDDGSRVVRGTLRSGPSADTLLCDVLLDVPMEGAGRGLRGTMSIPVGGVQELSVRSLDRSRTVGLVSASAILAAVILEAAFDIHNSKEGGDDGGGTDNARRVWLRVRF